MTQIIQYSLGIALWGSLVCLAVLLARPLIKKISNRFMRLLWVIVIVRFLCPLAIESPIPIVWNNTSEKAVTTADYSNTENYSKSNVENDLSIKNENNSVGKNSSDTLERPIQVESIPLDISGETSVGTPAGASVESETRAMEMSSDTIGEIQNGLETATKAIGTDGNASKAERNDKSTSKSFSIASISAWFASDFGQMILMICGIAWVIGSVVLLAIGAYKYWMICRSLDEAIFVKKWKNYPVKVTDYSGVPMSFGIFHPEIYLPPSFDDCDSVKSNATFSFRQKKMILLHEGMHLKHHDPLLKLVTYIMLAMHWWNPLVWLCVKYINIDIEMACDEAVLAKIGRRNRGEYAEALFSFAMKQSGISMIASFGESNAESRIKNTLHFRKPTMLGTALAMILVLGLSGCLALNPFGTGEKKQDDGTDQEGISEQLQANEIPENDNESSDALEESDHVQTDEYSDVKSETNEVDATGTTDTENSFREKISFDSVDPACIEAYRNIIEAVPEELDGIRYDFIYFNNDDIPDLVLDGPGYWVSLYTYIDGAVHCVMDQETYGIGARTSFSYFERKSAVCSIGHWHGGQISIWHFMLLNEKYEMDELSVIEEGVGLEEDDPDYEEIKKELEESKGWYLNGERISEAEYKNKLKDYSLDPEINLNTEQVSITLSLADKTKDEVLNMLANYGSTEIKNQNMAASSSSLYEGFKNGTEKLYFDRFQGEESQAFTTAVRDAVENGKGYTLSEFKKIVCDVYEWEENETTVNFDDMDCGQDGVMELAMKIDGPYDYGYGNSTYYIIKESAGRLYCTFGFNEFGRTGASLNKAGYYSQWGSSGAETHGGECGILDAEGVYHLNYASEQDGNYSSWKDNIDESLVGADEILRNTFHLEDDSVLYYYTVHTTKKDYACFWAENVSDDEIYDALTKAGMNVMHWNEIKKIMDEVSAGNGYTEEMENAPELFSYMYVD